MELIITTIVLVIFSFFTGMTVGAKAVMDGVKEGLEQRGENNADT